MTTPEQQAQTLVDKAMQLEAQALGLRMEAAKVLGLHDEARQYMNEMYVLVKARRASVFSKADTGAPCYFDAAGQAAEGAAQ